MLDTVLSEAVEEEDDAEDFGGCRACGAGTVGFLAILICVAGNGDVRRFRAGTEDGLDGGFSRNAIGFEVFGLLIKRYRDGCASPYFPSTVSVCKPRMVNAFWSFSHAAFVADVQRPRRVADCCDFVGVGGNGAGGAFTNFFMT